MSNGYYISLKKARQELAGRKHLAGDVEAWWKAVEGSLPPLPQKDDMAVFARHVATARYEDIYFAELATKAGLTPVWLEYLNDKFVDCSSCKRSYVHQLCCSGKGRNGGYRLKKKKLTNPHQWNGKPINKIIIDDGQSLIDYHHRFQDQVFGKPIRADMSVWLNCFGKAEDYYVYYLSLFLAHAVLFEDYHGGESGDRLDSFTTDIFEPAFAKLKRLFGIGPLIVAMPWLPPLKFYPADPDWRRYRVIPEVGYV